MKPPNGDDADSRFFFFFFFFLMDVVTIYLPKTFATATVSMASKDLSIGYLDPLGKSYHQGLEASGSLQSTPKPQSLKPEARQLHLRVCAL